MLVFHSPEPNQGIGWANKAHMPGDCDRSPSPGERERDTPNPGRGRTDIGGYELLPSGPSGKGAHRASTTPSKQASKQERDADRGLGTDGLRHRRGTETGPADECHKACVQMYGAAIDAAETPKSENSKLLKPQTSIRGG